MHVEAYTRAAKSLWDNFVRRSKNGTFLFLRDYMEYHAERFVDSSLLVFEDDGALLAILPANRVETLVSSHAGLTYGGFVTGDEMKLPKMLRVFETTVDYLRQNGITEFLYKTIPFIYHRAPAEEDRYALFIHNAQLTRRSAVSVLYCSAPLAMQERRKRSARKAEQSGVIVKESEDWKGYWDLLSGRLLESHKSAPIHTFEEIFLLQQRFPEHVRLFVASQHDIMVGGVVIYETDAVVRAQYIAANDAGRRLGAIDLIFTELLRDIYSSKVYFDFGTSDQQGGSGLNSGLIDQKEGYGARTVAHDCYLIRISNSGEFVET